MFVEAGYIAIGVSFALSIYISLAALSLIALRSAAGQGAITIYWLFTLVWSADTFAYFIGRGLGGPKLAPKLSPKAPLRSTKIA